MGSRIMHGHTRQVNGRKLKSLTYQSWSSMNDRCYIENHKWFYLYGGEGVEVCERWRRGTLNAFANFLADMGERPSKEMTLDRFPNTETKNYQPGNCRWADKATQRANQRPRTPKEPEPDAKFTTESVYESYDANRATN